MSHINVPMHSLTRPSKRIFRIKDLSGGISISKNTSFTADGKVSYMGNLIKSGETLKVREGIREISEPFTLTERLFSRTNEDFFGLCIFHIGPFLYAFDGEGMRMLYSGMPECQSFMAHMNSRLYVYSRDERIFIVEKDLSVSEYILPEYAVMTDAKCDLSEYTLCSIPDNVLYGSISVSYIEKISGTDYFILPCAADCQKEIKIYNSGTGNLMENIYYTVNGDRLELDREVYSAVKIVFYPEKGTKYRRCDRIFGCESVICYGGRNSHGNRVFFAGNKDYPGHYFYSDLLDPLKVSELSYDIIGNGNEDITALVRRKSDLIVFCKSRVDRITYSFDSESGASFDVFEICADTGCDLPGSIQLVDNRIVFASSEKGVYIIVSSDYTDELSVRSISANINGVGVSYGFLGNEKRLDGVHSVDYERTYRLFVGSYCYVWDYGNSPYCVSEDVVYAERVLSWYVLELPTAKDTFLHNGRLYGIFHDGKKDVMALADAETYTDFGNAIRSYIRIGPLDLSNPEAKKIIYEMYLTMLVPCERVDIIASGDKMEYMHRSIPLEETDATLGGTYVSGPYRVRVCLPRYESVRFTFDIESNDGRFGISEVALRYIGDGIYHNDESYL